MATKTATKQARPPAKKAARRPAKPATVVPAADVRVAGASIVMPTVPQLDVIIVKTKDSVPTLRRGGYRFTREPYGIAISALTPEQLRQIEREPELETERGTIDAPTAEELSGDAPAADPGSVADLATTSSEV